MIDQEQESNTQSWEYKKVAKKLIVWILKLLWIFFLSKDEEGLFADTPKPIIPAFITFKICKAIFLLLLSQSNRGNLIILKQRSNKLLNSLPCC